MNRPAAALGLAAALLLAPRGAPALQFSSSFESIKVRARPGELVTRTWQLHLAAGQPASRFHARVEDWWQSEGGEQSFYRPPGTLARSCGRWITLNPVEATVQPGGVLEVRVSAAVPLAAQPGGYWCVLTVDELQDPLSGTPSVGIRLLSSISTGIFLFLDPTVRRVEITDVDISPRRARVRVRNTGNAPVGIEGRVEFRAAGAATPAVSAAFPRTTVLPEPIASRSFGVDLPDLAALPAGSYRVRVVLDLGLDHDVGVERDLVIPRDLAMPSKNR